jgi:transcriptional regulator with XRE-family HTH domain
MPQLRVPPSSVEEATLTTGHPDIDHQIGTALREARLARSLTQAAVAAAIGVNRTTIARYERGIRKIPVRQLRQIALLLEQPLSRFVPGVGHLEEP